VGVTPTESPGGPVGATPITAPVGKPPLPSIFRGGDGDGGRRASAPPQGAVANEPARDATCADGNVVLLPLPKNYVWREGYIYVRKKIAGVVRLRSCKTKNISVALRRGAGWIKQWQVGADKAEDARAAGKSVQR
jgi:hypothetical protein